MLEFNSVLTDLERYFPNTKFKNKNIIEERLKLFFKNKFSLFLQENPISNEEGFNNLIIFFNENALFPMRKRCLNVDHISGLQGSFIHLYREDIFNFIPTDCKKDKTGMNLSRLSDKNLLIYNNFLFYLYLKSFSFSYNFKMSMILEEFDLNLNDLDISLHYLFQYKEDEINYAPFTFNNDLFRSALVKDMYFRALDIICPGHLFYIEKWYSLFSFERDNFETRKIKENKIILNEELNRRRLNNYFVDDLDLIIQRTYFGIERNVTYSRDMFSLFTILRNTGKHLL